jgi:hypothetical protein
MHLRVVSSGMRLRKTIAVVAVGVAVPAVTAPVASADKVTVTIDTDAAGQGRYSGKVMTKRDKCAQRRTVQVFDQTAGGFFIGETRTDNKGRYELFEFVPQPGQQVRVVVPPKKNCPGVSNIAAVPEDPGVP